MFVGLLNVCAIGSFDESLASNSKGCLKSISLNNRPYQTRQTLVDINSSETHFIHLLISANKCGGSCNTTDDQVCVPSKFKNMNGKVFNLMSG